MSRTIFLLGPQRLQPTLVSVFEEMGWHGPVAAVTAGWQEREAEVDEMQAHLHREVVNLMLHQRSEEVLADDPELAREYRARQERLRELQEVYRGRLAHALAAAREVQALQGDDALLEPERKAAIQTVRSLDAHHLKRLEALHDEFVARLDPLARPAVARQRRELAKLLADCGVLAIAGGHVAVLLNRLRLFGILDLIDERPIVAWSAGAMVLGDRVVLFHDFPPQGPGNAEVLERGLGEYSDLVPLPHADKRLRLADQPRVSLFARRFAPAVCVALEGGSRLSRLNGGAWVPTEGTRVLTARGEVRRTAAS